MMGWQRDLAVLARRATEALEQIAMTLATNGVTIKLGPDPDEGSTE